MTKAFAIWATLISLTASSCISSGCAMITPSTRLGINPITRTFFFEDTKDNEVSLTDAEFSTETGFRIGQLEISNTSSSVIKENINQMIAFTVQQQKANEGIATALAGIAEIVSQLAGIVGNTGPSTPDVQTIPTVPVN